MEIGLRRVWPDAAIRARPMADGGEGTLDAILHAAGAGAWSRLCARVAQARIAILSDVNNPLCGPLGAIAVFGPQKGVTGEDIAPFDATVQRFAQLAEAAFARRVAMQPGAGAAGGLG